MSFNRTLEIPRMSIATYITTRYKTYTTHVTPLTQHTLDDAMKAKSRAKARCINPECTTHGLQTRRGLCEACYHVMLRLIKAGMLPNWEAAERRGLCKPKRKPGQDRFPSFVESAVVTTKPKK